MTKALEILGIGLLAFIGFALCDKANAKPAAAPATPTPNENEKLQPINEPTPCRSTGESDPPAQPEQPQPPHEAESDVPHEAQQHAL